MAGPFLVARNRVVIDAPARQVFEYLSDLSRHNEWIGEEEYRVTALPDGPATEGSRLRRERTGVMRGPLIVRGGMSDNPLRVVKVTTITLLEPDTDLVIETRNIYNSLLHSIEKYTFALQPEASAEGSATAVTMVSEVEPMVPGAFIGPVYAIRFVRGMFDKLFGHWLSGEASVGPHLAKVKEKTEAAQIADTP